VARFDAARRAFRVAVHRVAAPENLSALRLGQRGLAPAIPSRMFAAPKR
jgi:hypothetical protein